MVYSSLSSSEAAWSEELEAMGGTSNSSDVEVLSSPGLPNRSSNGAFLLLWAFFAQYYRGSVVRLLSYEADVEDTRVVVALRGG